MNFPSALPIVSLRTGSATLLALALIACCGCGNADSSGEPKTPVAARSITSFDEPLTEADIETFLAVVDDLPGGKVPELEPLARSSIDDRLPAATQVNAYRDEYRRMFDPVEQGRQWRDNEALASVLSAHGIRPDQFAALLTRLGCAVAAGAMTSRVDLAEASAKADRQLQSLVDRIDMHDRRIAEGSVSAAAVVQNRQVLVDQLRNLVALSEFSRILLSVSEASLAAVAGQKEALSAHLPQAQDIRMFERTLDAKAVIVPVNYEQPKSSPSKK